MGTADTRVRTEPDAPVLSSVGPLGFVLLCNPCPSFVLLTSNIQILKTDKPCTFHHNSIVALNFRSTGIVLYYWLRNQNIALLNYSYCIKSRFGSEKNLKPNPVYKSLHIKQMYQPFI